MSNIQISAWNYRRMKISQTFKFAALPRILIGLVCGLTAQLAVAEVADTDSLQLKWLRMQAVAFEHGEGVEKDSIKAQALYCEAARLGDIEAMFSLGWMYANGRGIPRDDSRAAFLFRRAAQAGNEHALRMTKYLVDLDEAQPDCWRVDVTEEVSRGDEQNSNMEADLFSQVPKRILDLVNKLAPEYSVQPKLALAVIKTESGFDTRAVSPRSAQGLMQLIPDTAKRFNVRNPFDPEQNIRGGLAYLRWLLTYFRGQVPLVLAGYNAGEGAVDRYRGVPPFLETRNYVKRVIALYGSEDHPYVEDVTTRANETRYR